VIRRLRRASVIVLVSLVTFGCGGRFDYSPPTSPPLPQNSRIVKRPFDAVWKDLVPALGRRFFVINNIDRASGLINLSYSGDPERYIDCGSMSSHIKNLRGERRYDFPAASAMQTYEVLSDQGLFVIERKMSLEGRMNLIVEEVSPTETRLTANTRYVATRSGTSRRIDQVALAAPTDTIAFNSGGQANFPVRGTQAPVTCHATGRFEREVLDLIQ
jgi:hypothetical protein